MMSVTKIASMTTTLDSWRARWIVEALRTLDEKWQATLAISDDEDVHADLGMDIIKLHMLREQFEADAVEAFGPQITQFSREPLVLNKPKI